MSREYQHATATGGGPPLTVKYTRWEDMLRPSISEVAIIGIGGVDTGNLPLSSDESGEEPAQQPQAPPSPRYESGGDQLPPRGDIEDIPLYSEEAAPTAEEIPAPADPLAPADPHAPAACRAPAVPEEEEIAEVQLLVDFQEQMRASRRENIQTRVQMSEDIRAIREGQRKIIQGQNRLVQILTDLFKFLREAHAGSSAAGPSAAGPSEPGPSATGPSEPGTSAPGTPQSPPQPGHPSTLPSPLPMRLRLWGVGATDPFNEFSREMSHT
ncbi:uncharacterized protein LOC128647314 [Bombina bombina]|uniref:uncharacterized protein LOC128647314 n=1 Tax=Bombina bombina TaxID=8345 RepID=UPI00235A87E1|nr:uncharacterized protein LOC128647314 [Bombina bombina]